MTLPDPLAVLARELALLERKGFTLTDQERRFIDSWRGGGAPTLIAEHRRRKFRVIQGGRA